MESKILMQPKYFYIDDDTAVLFAANGTPLLAVMATITDIIPMSKISIPTFPMWIYLFGLVFAFIAKAMIQLMNDDIRQREKLQYGRDFTVEALGREDLPPEVKAQLDTGWIALEAQYAKLLKIHHVPMINNVRALSFYLSAICFLISTSTLIYLAGVILKR